MAINVAWDNDQKTIIRWDFVGLWDWDMVYAATAQSVTLRKSVNHTQSISVIINMENAAPTRPGALTHMRNALLINPEGRDVVVVAGRSAYTQTLVEIFRKMNIRLSEQILSADSLSHARTMIRQRGAEVG